VKPISASCEPRSDILAGTFNPEIFTLSVGDVLNFYRSKKAAVHPIYTDAEQFFTQATYPTDGLKTTLQEVFARLGGDNTAPAIHRLETAFGGGKTHILVACTHIAFRGTEIADATESIIDAGLLPEPQQVDVVGVAGDDLAVHRSQGRELVPYTLWGEIAFQIGGAELYKQVEEAATSYAAPGKEYFTKVFGDRKVLVMIDELAQYAARLEAVHLGGGKQLGAFLMALHRHARSTPGVAVILTLASAQDAFADETERLAKLISDVRGQEVSEQDALGIGQDALKDVSSVVARDASPVTPVQAAEISRVLAQRLFQRIEDQAAEAAAEAYVALYTRNQGLLPEEATRADFRDRMVSHYPFHPTLVDFLNNKLSTAESFQGTRGVLRVLALAVRNLWQKGLHNIPMIHTCHIDLRNARTVNEVASRTGSGDLLPVLNADVGGVDTPNLEGGRSNAELADRRNPHPGGIPMYEYTWKTVFLHSLVGRDEGLRSNVFGIAEADALFEVSFPGAADGSEGLTPPQVMTALEEIEKTAFYLHKDQGRYYASLVPQPNKALARIRRSLSADQVRQEIASAARKVVKADVRTFHVVHDVSAPEHVPDKEGRPVLGLVAMDADPVDPGEFITTAGPNRPRIEQNTVFLLVPQTVPVRGAGQEGLFGDGDQARDILHRVEENARWALAVRELRRRPQDYGISPDKLDEDRFRDRAGKIGNDLETSVARAYNSLWYPSGSGQVARKEIKTAGGEGGAGILETIRKTLRDEGKLVTSEHTTQADLMNLSALFFEQADVASLEQLRENFLRIRRWPVLDDPGVFDQVIRAGVSRGTWCLFRMGSDENVRPDEFYSRETGDLPFELDLTQPGYSIVTPQGAKQRGWTAVDRPEPTKVRTWVREAATEAEVATVADLGERVAEMHGSVPDTDLQEAVANVVREGRLVAYKGKPDQKKKPDLVTGPDAMLYTPAPTDVILTKAKAAERGWLKAEVRALDLSGKKAAEILVPLLRRLGSLYNKGAKTTIDELDLTELRLPKGGTLRLTLSKVPPDSMKQLGELLETLDRVVTIGKDTEAFLRIAEPDESCPLIQELKKQTGQEESGA